MEYKVLTTLDKSEVVETYGNYDFCQGYICAKMVMLKEMGAFRVVTETSTMKILVSDLTNTIITMHIEPSIKK